MNWRKWNNIIHRDMGYLCVGLTLIYAISGIAVNHTADWNPNYRIERSESHITPISSGTDDPGQLASAILKQMGINKPIENTFRPDPETIQIFMDKHTVTANYVTGVVQQEIVNRRLVLREMNILHLNEPKQWWTYVADLYAVCLAVLAITGLFVLKGKNGLTGRGSWLTAVGFVIPIVFLWWYW